MILDLHKRHGWKIGKNYSGADPIKLFFRFSLCLVRMIKNVSTVKWPSLTAKNGKRRKKSFIGSALGLTSKLT